MEERFHEGGVAPELLRSLLTDRRDGPGILRITVQTALLFATGALLVGAVGPAQIAAALVMHGFVQMTFFGAFHESAHGTAFTTKARNRLVCGWAGLIEYGTYPWMRSFHFTHHRHTHEMGTDPELAGMEWMARWPTGLLWIANASGFVIWGGRLGILLSSALGLPRVAREQLLPYVKDSERDGIVRAARIVVLIHVAFVVLALAVEPRLLRYYAGSAVAHVFLSLYLTCEHRGLAMEGTVVERTRSFDTGPVLRWFLWNMPMHAEHHAYPGVPFYNLPKLHEAMKDELVHDTPGVIALHLRGGRAA